MKNQEQTKLHFGLVMRPIGALYPSKLTCPDCGGAVLTVDGKVINTGKGKVGICMAVCGCGSTIFLFTVRSPLQIGIGRKVMTSLMEGMVGYGVITPDMVDSMQTGEKYHG